ADSFAEKRRGLLAASLCFWIRRAGYGFGAKGERSAGLARDDGRCEGWGELAVSKILSQQRRQILGARGGLRSIQGPLGGDSVAYRYEGCAVAWRPTGSGLAGGVLRL